MYSVDTSNCQVILRYSDVFSERKPNLIDKIKKANMHKIISIISELIQIRDAECESTSVGGMKISIPLETVLKRDYCGMKAESPEKIIENPMLRKNQLIISLQMLLILLKKVIIYGNYDSLKNNIYEITDQDYKEVIMMQLLVADEISRKNEIPIDSDHFLYASYHLNYKRDVANEFSRMYYMMECLSTNPQLFSDNIKEYRNYYEKFTSKYGVTPTEYSSLLFRELQYYYSKKNKLSKTKNWRNIDTLYKHANEKEKLSKVINILIKKPDELRDWAKETETKEWDFKLFYEFPFISDGRSEYISVSDVTLRNAFFEKIFWLIRNCYPKEDSTSMAFFGRLFERYIQDATKEACSNNYTYINEFHIQQNKKGELKSSDAYVRKNNNLLAVEAKGFSVLNDCMTKGVDIEKNNKKLFVDPVLQADEFLSKVWTNEKKFNGIDEVFIISVTFDNINAVPQYYYDIYNKINENKKCHKVHYYFNFSIEEYEMLLYAIELGIDIFVILKNYFENKIISPFCNYLTEQVADIKMTKFIKNNFDSAVYKMNEILGG